LFSTASLQELVGFRVFFAANAALSLVNMERVGVGVVFSLRDHQKSHTASYPKATEVRLVNPSNI
jgi:hypothetical protein